MTENLISHSDLLKLIKYDCESGLFTWIAPRKNIRVGEIAGRQRRDGYKDVKLLQRYYMQHRLAWFYVHKYWPTYEIDHINRIRNDNRIVNLREANASQNQQNIIRTKVSKTGKRGVTYEQNKNRWRALLHVMGRKIHLGYHKTFQEALESRLAGERKYFSHRVCAP